MASYPTSSITHEKEPMFSCSSYLDSIPVVDLGYSPMGALEPILSPVGQSECYDICSLQDLFPSDEALLEAMVSIDIPLDHFDQVLSTDHVPGWDPFVVKHNPNLPSEIDLTIGRSIECNTLESFDSVSELQVSVPVESNFFYHEFLGLSSKFNGLGCEILDSLYESDLYDQEFLGVSSEFDLLIYQVLDFVFESNSFGIISELGD